MAFFCARTTMLSWRSLSPIFLRSSPVTRLSRQFSVWMFRSRYQMSCKEIRTVLATKPGNIDSTCFFAKANFGMNVGDNNNISSVSVHPHERTIFAAKLSVETSEASLRKYFSQYGDVEDVALVRNSNTGKSKCFAFSFIQFKDSSSVQKVLEDKHFLDQRWIRTERNRVGELRAHKVCVQNLRPELTEESLRNHFSQFGEVKSIDFVLDNNTCQRKDFCFVEFTSVEASNKALAWPTHSIQQTEVLVRKNIARVKKFVPGRILAGGLEDDVTVHDLNAYFEEFGSVTSVEMNFLRDGEKPRNFGFVTFKNTTVPDLVRISDITHRLNGQKFRVSKAVSNISMKNRDFKVFIENVPAGKNVGEIRACFEAFGPVDEVHCIERRKPTDDAQCFVIKFAVEVDAENASQDRSVWMDDHNLLIRKLGWTSTRET